LKKIDFLKLDKKIIEKIKNIIKKWEKNFEMSQNDFFIWWESFENIYIFYVNEKSKKTLIEFLWEKLPKLPNNITLLTNTNNNLIDLIDTALLSRYKYEKYKTKKEEKITNIIITLDEKNIVEERLKTINNIILARDLSETPSNDLTPESFVKIIKETKFKNTKIKILTPKEIEKKWLGLITAVWKWSYNKPYVVILERIVNKNKPTFWLVWKWLTFDSGWIQVKPWNSMYLMKGDMSWAAITYATMKELDNKNLNVNIVACLCLVENTISWESYKPSDIITAYNKKTVDIIHTDAEWRLILADWISYISKNYKLNNIISIATLTWWVLSALGYRYAWIMWNDKKLIKKFITYSDKNFEKYVQLPFDNYFIEKTKSEIADLENLNHNVKASASMWAAFLFNFVDNNELYTHIDIAGVAINEFESYWLFNKWMTGFWVDSISNILLNLE
jgi:leucyl aminopeptidase